MNIGVMLMHESLPLLLVIFWTFSLPLLGLWLWVKTNFSSSLMLIWRREQDAITGTVSALAVVRARKTAASIIILDGVMVIGVQFYDEQTRCNRR
jgi:hypothetical protein